MPVNEFQAELNLIHIKNLAKEFEWVEIDHQPNIYMISFTREGVRLNYYYSKGTLSTSMDHPTKGKTQLFRKCSDHKTLRKIFKYPRFHSGVGYYKKDQI